MGPRARAPRLITVKPPQDARPDYIRFVCFQLVERQKSRLGLFQAIDLARDSELAPDWALHQMSSVSAWFSDNLLVPSVFRRASHRDAQPALCWFKPTALSHISKMYELKAALEACGVHVDVVRSKRPGIVVYEDEFQIAATAYAARF